MDAQNIAAAMELLSIFVGVSSEADTVELDGATVTIRSRPYDNGRDVYVDMDEITVVPDGTTSFVFVNAGVEVTHPDGDTWLYYDRSIDFMFS